MSQAQHKATLLQDYTPPPFVVDHIHLRFELHESHTRVTSIMMFRRHDRNQSTDQTLFLYGENQKLLNIELDDKRIDLSRYNLTAQGLTLHDTPDQGKLTITSEINPKANTALEGLYLSNQLFCTQCEAEGFRKITYFLDRPDVLSRFTTTIIADKNDYPTLLANGNPIKRGNWDDQRHFVTWEDPFPKPCYLFALVAGKLEYQQDSFTTQSHREIDLRIYVEPENIDKCQHALTSLKKSMRWDEQRFGREYDLDIYMIVAVNDFNFGAMENKGLNIFNAKYVLAKPETATDMDYEQIENVIAHEYFHNWTGNRITLREWFQLSLKEGLTVFRDQEFSSDMNSRPVQRINDVRILRTHQFAEDSGPTAHPVRPDSYIEINNFYTLTVYNKGAEVIRMVHTLLGEENFRKGMDLYFERFDGQAITMEDFINAMAEASGQDLQQFSHWYLQAGTPEIHAEGQFDQEKQIYTLTLKQQCKATPGQPKKHPFQIPITMGLLNSQGEAIPLQSPDETSTPVMERTLALKKAEAQFSFKVKEPPIPSLLRGFSAPVKLHMKRSEQELAFLWAHDTDPFNRWDAGQTLAIQTLTQLVKAIKTQKPLQLSPDFIDAFSGTLTDKKLDNALKAQALILPSIPFLLEIKLPADPDPLFKAREFIRTTLAKHLEAQLLKHYHESQTPGAYQFTPEDSGKRSLKAVCLAYLLTQPNPETQQLAMDQFRQGGNMTDQFNALQAMVHAGHPEQDDALAYFYKTWQQDPLVIDKWFSIQATSPQENTLKRVIKLTQHKDFTLRNPNRVRALIGAFCAGNPVRFHSASGEGYRFLTDHILKLDQINPTVAARMLGIFSGWRKMEPHRAALMKQEIEHILKRKQLSRDAFEIASKSLAAPQAK
ncbi:aminopeptidase N [Magnetococcales bacterium HHB-1]